MVQLTDGKPPKSGTSRFSKASPAVPGLTVSSPEPMPTNLPVSPKVLPNPPPLPPPHSYADTSSSPSSPSIQNERPLPAPKEKDSSDRLAAPAPQKMIFSRRPVGDNKSSSAASNKSSSNNDSKAGKGSAYTLYEPSPALSISSLISAYSRPYESRNTSASPSQAATPSTSSRDTSPSSRSNYESYKSYKPAAEPEVKPQPPVPPKNSTRSLTPQTIASSEFAPKVPAKSELWRRRPQNESKELPGLELHHSRGSTASTTRPSTAVKSDSSSTTSNNSTPRANRQPPANDGLPANVKPDFSGIPLVQFDSQPNLLQNKSSTMSLSNQTVTAPRPGGNGPPTPERQKDEQQVPVTNTIVSPDSPVSSPQSPAKTSSSTSKGQPPPQHNEASRTEVPRRRPAPLPANGQAANGQAANGQSAAAANRKVQEVEAVKQSSSDTSGITARTSANSDSSRSMPRSDDPSQDSSRSPTRRPPPQRRPKEEQSDLSQQNSSRSPSRRLPPLRGPTEEQSDPSQDSPRSSTRRPPPHRGPMEKQHSPRRERPQLNDPRIVHSDEHGPMYRGRYGTLYPEMKSLVKPDARAFRFPPWKGEPIHSDAIIKAHAVKDSHHSCFQKHRLMNRRVNRNYPLTCQTCGKADNDDRYACSFCHLRICESCNRTFNNHQRDLSSLMAALARQTPLSLSSSSRPTSAFGLKAGA